MRQVLEPPAQVLEPPAKYWCTNQASLQATASIGARNQNKIKSTKPTTRCKRCNKRQRSALVTGTGNQFMPRPISTALPLGDTLMRRHVIAAGRSNGFNQRGICEIAFEKHHTQRQPPTGSTASPHTLAASSPVIIHARSILRKTPADLSLHLASESDVTPLQLDIIFTQCPNSTNKHPRK